MQIIVKKINPIGFAIRNRSKIDIVKCEISNVSYSILSESIS
jgi:hypothetical protein